MLECSRNQNFGFSERNSEAIFDFSSMLLFYFFFFFFFFFLQRHSLKLRVKSSFEAESKGFLSCEAGETITLISKDRHRYVIMKEGLFRNYDWPLCFRCFSLRPCPH